MPQRDGIFVAPFGIIGNPPSFPLAALTFGSGQRDREKNDSRVNTIDLVPVPSPNRTEALARLLLRRESSESGKTVCVGNRSRLILLRDDSRLILTVSPGNAAASAEAAPGESSSNAAASAAVAPEECFRYGYSFGRSDVRRFDRRNERVAMILGNLYVPAPLWYRALLQLDGFGRSEEAINDIKR
jgi:hypothetical protein